MSLKATYDKIAEFWKKDHGDDSWWHEGTDKFLSFLPSGASILDMGCGTGVKSNYLSRKGFNVTGADFSEKMVALATHDYPQVTFEVVDLYDLDSYGKKFDAVFTQAVLLHIPKNRIVEILKKLKGKLNPGGFLYVAVKEIRPGQPDEGILKEDDYGFEYERFFSYYDTAELKGYLTQAGLEPIWEKRHLEKATYWIQVIAKKQ